LAILMGTMEVIKADNINRWKVLKRFSIDLDNDKIPEKIILSSEVELDKNGEILWDDGQWWKLSIIKEEKEIVLVKEFIQLGVLYMSIGIEKGQNLPAIVLVKDDQDTFSVYKFFFDHKIKGYKSQIILSICKKDDSALPYFYQFPEQ